MTISMWLNCSKFSFIGLKTLWKKEKTLVTSGLSFSYSAFKMLLFQGRKKSALCGNWFYRCYNFVCTFSKMLSKALQSPSLVLVKPRENMNNVSCRLDMTEKC